MAVEHNTVLAMLGKSVSFDVVLPADLQVFFPDGIKQHGIVEAVVLELSGNHQILVNGEFFSLANITMS